MAPTDGSPSAVPHRRGMIYRRRVAGAMAVAMTLLALVGMLAIPTVEPNLALVGCDLAIFALGAVMLIAPGAAPEWSSQILIGFVTVVITVAVSVGGGYDSAVGNLPVLYLPTALYAFSFISTRAGFLQVGVAGVAYAILLATSDAGANVAVAHWGTVMGALVVAGLMVAAMNREVDRLVFELDRAAARDPLTGTLNLRGFEGRLEVELSRARRADEPLSILAIDLDGLKAVNDHFGHAAGDAVLRLVARVLGRDLRDADALGRVGDDEFLILLPACDLQAAAAIAEKVRRELGTAAAGEGWPVSLSIGVACAPPARLDGATLRATADAALYRAKQAGRDRVAGADEAAVRLVHSAGA